MILVNNVSKNYKTSYSSSKALDGISFKISKSEFIAIMGPSGSGKTTLLNCLSTIDSVSKGNIYYSGVDITKLNNKEQADFRREHLGFVFQEYNLLDTLSVRDNIALPLTLNNNTLNVKEKVDAIATRLMIEDLLDKYPYQISGGERQRCACARALINKPQLLMADEPTGALDSYAANNFLDLLTQVNLEFGTTIMMVTHNPLSASIANRILFLQDGKMHKEIQRVAQLKENFYHSIIETVLAMGGEMGAL